MINHNLNLDTNTSTELLLDVRKLCTSFFTSQGTVKAVDGVDLTLLPGEALGLVGESGCGKSVFARSILRLVTPPGRIISGQILFKGRDLLKLSKNQIRRIRGRSIAAIFQDPLTTLNPVLQVGHQIAEVLTHRSRSEEVDNVSKRSVIQKRVIELMRLVQIPSPLERYHQYPFELSGGMRQRVVIAAGLANNPHLLIADEPTTALDVTVQAQILNLLGEIKEKHRTSILFITHDLGIVNYICERAAVMYAGKIVEQGKSTQILTSPKHPYTQGLLSCLPKLYGSKDLQAIPGEVPDLFNLPRGCSFQDRCPYMMKRCRSEEPQLQPLQTGWFVSCHLYSHMNEEKEDKKI